MIRFRGARQKYWKTRLFARQTFRKRIKMPVKSSGRDDDEILNNTKSTSQQCSISMEELSEQPDLTPPVRYSEIYTSKINIQISRKCCLNQDLSSNDVIQPKEDPPSFFSFRI